MTEWKGNRFIAGLCSLTVSIITYLRSFPGSLLLHCKVFIGVEVLVHVGSVLHEDRNICLHYQSVLRIRIVIFWAPGSDSATPLLCLTNKNTLRHFKTLYPNLVCDLKKNLSRSRIFTLLSRDPDCNCNCNLDRISNSLLRGHDFIPPVLILKNLIKYLWIILDFREKIHAPK